jgi:UDP-N-acetylmuramate--alanine ligase
MDDFATCFKGADLAIIADIYSVRDSAEEKRLTSTPMLVERINAAGSNAMHIATFPQILDYLKQNAAAGDLVLTIGAGNVCDIARDLANSGQPAAV